MYLHMGDELGKGSKRRNRWEEERGGTDEREMRFFKIPQVRYFHEAAGARLCSALKSCVNGLEVIFFYLLLLQSVKNSMSRYTRTILPVSNPHRPNQRQRQSCAIQSHRCHALDDKIKG